MFVWIVDVLELKRQNQKLQSIIDQIKNDQLALQIQIERLEQKLADQYDKYRSEVSEQRRQRFKLCLVYKGQRLIRCIDESKLYKNRKLLVS